MQEPVHSSAQRHLRAGAVELREERVAAVVQRQLLKRALRLPVQHRGALTLAQPLHEQAACGRGGGRRHGRGAVEAARRRSLLRRVARRMHRSTSPALPA